MLCKLFECFYLILVNKIYFVLFNLFLNDFIHFYLTLLNFSAMKVKPPPLWYVIAV